MTIDTKPRQAEKKEKKKQKKNKRKKKTNQAKCVRVIKGLAHAHKHKTQTG